MKKYKLFLYLAALSFGLEGIDNIRALYTNTTIQPSLFIGVCYIIAAVILTYILIKEK